MKIPVKKLLFMGTKEACDDFFRRAQEAGCCEFTSVSEQRPHNFPKEIEEIKEALKVLRGVTPQPQNIITPTDYPALIHDILRCHAEKVQKEEEADNLEETIEHIRPLGEFDLDKLREFESETYMYVQFFTVPADKFYHEELPKEVIFVAHAYDLDYYMTIGRKRFYHESFTEIFLEKRLNALEDDLKNNRKTQEDLYQELKKHAANLQALEDYLIDEMNQVLLDFAKSDIDIILEDKMFAIDAWVPETHMKELEEIAKDLPVAYQEVATEEDDKIPTYLENKGFRKVGEDLVWIYDTPSVGDKDPSTWVLGSFALFFGMIIADAGYGLLFLMLSTFLWLRFPQWTGIKRRMVKLAFLLSGVSIAWGVLIASYFSIPLSPHNPLSKMSLVYYLSHAKVDYHMSHNTETYQGWMHEFPSLTQKTKPAELLEGAVTTKGGKTSYALVEEINDAVFMELALLVGIIHLSCSLIRNLYRNWSGIGWVATLWGGYLYFPIMLDTVSFIQVLGLMSEPTAKLLGLELLWGGLGLAMLLSIIQEKWLGLASIFKVIELFSDTLSYLRLYALGLASMIMASTFNHLGQMMNSAILGSFVVLFGHVVNIGLAIMGGVIHGLRLNFLEWYHHSFEGGGHRFNPLRLFSHHN